MYATTSSMMLTVAMLGANNMSDNATANALNGTSAMLGANASNATGTGATAAPARLVFEPTGTGLDILAAAVLMPDGGFNKSNVDPGVLFEQLQPYKYLNNTSLYQLIFDLVSEQMQAL